MKRIISSLVICLFLSNDTVFAALPRYDNMDPSETLQVQSIFKPVTDHVGRENAEALRIETALILAMALRDGEMPFHEINAELDKWYSRIDGKARLMEVLPGGVWKEDGRTVVAVTVVRGPYKGKKLKISSTCRSIQDIQKDETRINIEPADAEDVAAAEPVQDEYLKIMPMEIARARKAPKAEIIYTARIKDEGKRREMIDGAIKAYRDDVPDVVVDYDDGIDRSRDDMIIIRELGGPILGFVSYGKVGRTGYKIYFHYVMRQERGRGVGRNLLRELVTELSRDIDKENRWRLTTTFLTYNGENIWSGMFGPGTIKGEVRLDTGEYIRRAHLDLRKYPDVRTGPIYAKQPILNDSFVATIDGPSGTGKSSSASEAAKMLGAVFFSAGKIYRLITWLALKEGLDIKKDMDRSTKEELRKIAENIDMAKFRMEETEGTTRSFYGEQEITEIFYSEDISGNVPFVSAIPEIRWFAVRKIREMIDTLRARGVSVVLEGRTTGIEIAPDADIKIYMTASPEERAERRTRQMVKKEGLEASYCNVIGTTPGEYARIAESVSEEERFGRMVEAVAGSIARRDELDEHREHMPSRRPKNAVVLDSSGKTLETTIREVVDNIEIARIRGLVERNIKLDEEGFSRLNTFYYKYRKLAGQFEGKGSDMWGRGPDRMEEYMKPEHIADMFYLSEVYEFDMWDLLGEKRSTKWVSGTGPDRVEYEFRIEENSDIAMVEIGPDGNELREVARAERGSYGVRNYQDNRGRGLGNFIIKTHYLILWAKRYIRREDVLIAALGGAGLIGYYDTIGATTYRDSDGDMRASIELVGGISAAILDPRQAAKIKSLDPRIWRVWSQRNMDRYLSLVEQVDPEVLEKAHKDFSDEHSAEKIETVREITPGTVANYVLLKMMEAKRSEKAAVGPAAPSGRMEFTPLAATDAFYALKEEAGKEVSAAVSASSISVDKDTGKTRYLTVGKKFTPIMAQVYVKEGAKWDIPVGVEFPGHLSSIINGDNGALVLTTGPFYAKVEGAPTIAYVRPLTDQEVYERYGLRRVYGKDDKPFEMPALGIAGRSMLLPIPYTVVTSRTSSGERIIRTTDDLRSGGEESRHVFGLEFKNAGTPSYEKHNINSSFPATVIDEYVGKPGIFLDWWHQLATRNPVGLGDEYGTTIPREISVLNDGGSLTRWTLANMTLEAPYVITLRVPVGDYRRLSSFFDTDGAPKKKEFNDALDELGFGSLEEYFREMCRNYGRNMRRLVNNNIMESTHGSMINTDMLGNITDLGDFWEIAGENERFLRHGVDARIDNLIKVLDLAGEENKAVQNEALKYFAAAYFGGEMNVNMIEMSVDDPDRLKDAVYQHALGMIRVIGEAGEAAAGELARRVSEARDNVQRSHVAAIMAFTGLKRHLEAVFDDPSMPGKMAPVHIVVDLSLISGLDRRDMEANITTWAHLMLLCRDLENVRFSFRQPYPVDMKTMPESLLTEIRNGASEEEVRFLLKGRIRELSVLFGQDIDADAIMNGKLNADQAENAIEIPILSKAWLEWMRDSGMELGPGEFPVAMDGLTGINNKQVVFRNFEAALMIGLSKAALVIAKRRGRGVSALEEEEMNKVIEDTRMLSRLRDLYAVLSDGSIGITEKTLKNMVYDDSSTRINLAISLAIPPMARMPVEKLLELHSAMQDLLKAA
ncbi:MAG: (d)CMP kinase [Candidatus Omnitrophica bacterium]|nr:(d)CMP kinase [Candidatus Omnitrophota bacterium]